MSLSFRLVLLAGVAVSGLDPSVASAQDVSKVRVVVPQVVGRSNWGTGNITRALRRTVAKSVELVPAEQLGPAPTGNPTSRPYLDRLARTGRAAGADYVLHSFVIKSGWLYTAHALLVDTDTGEVRMDFRSGYYLPEAETEDRGFRIASKAVEKIGELWPEKIAARSTEPNKVTTATVAATETVETSTSSDVSSSGDSFSDAFFASDGSAALEEFDVNAEFDAVESAGGWQWTARGWIGSKATAYISNAVPDGVQRSLVKAGVRTTVTGSYGNMIRVRVLPLVEGDLVNQRLHRVVIEEAFMEVQLHPIELRVGWDSLTWGSASTLNIVDVLNTRDLTEGLLDAPKIGQPMVAARWLFGNNSLSLLYLTPFVQPVLPRFGTVFNPFPPELGSMGALPIALGSKYDEWQPQAAARLAMTFGRLDVRAAYFYGYERIPMVYAPALGLIFPLTHQVSTDGQWLIGGTALKWEFATIWHPETERTRSPPFTLPMQPMTAAPPLALPGVRVVGLVGIEHTFEGVLGGTTIIPVLEVFGTSDSTLFRDERPPDDATQFIQNHAIAAVRWNFENGVDSKLEVSDLMDLSEPTDHLVTLEYSERWFGQFTFVTGVRWVFAKDGNRMAAFKALSGVYGEVQLNF